MARPRSYGSLIKRLKSALISDHGAISPIGELINHRRYTLIKVVLGAGNPKRALISAGIHGDEPAGVDALCAFLKERRYLPFIGDWELTLLPCINPTGYELGTRKNSDNIDLNRKFKVKSPPLEVRFTQLIFREKFDLTLELHEDVDSAGYYLYQAINSDKKATLGYQILDQVKRVMPINMNPKIEDMSAEKGVIKAAVHPEKMKWWPMAIYSLARETRCCLTLETATRYPLKARVEAHQLAIETALENFKHPR